MKFRFLFIIFSFSFIFLSWAEDKAQVLQLFESNSWRLSRKDFYVDKKLESTQYEVSYLDKKSAQETRYFVDTGLWYFFNSESLHKKLLENSKFTFEAPSVALRRKLYTAYLDDLHAGKKAALKKMLMEKKKKSPEDEWIIQNYFKP